MPMRRIGKLGENKVEGWAFESDITVNRVGDDRGGWDLFMQFPHKDECESKTNIFLDIRPPELTCLVQVKATDNNQGSIKDVKLSNWERLVKSPLPVFFIVIDFNKTNEVQNAYLIHVGKSLIEKTLRRLRQLSDEDKKRLHKKYMALSYTDNDRIQSPGGTSMIREIYKHVGKNPHQYFNEKLDYLKTCGYSDYPIKAQFTVHGENKEEVMNQLVDFSIGNAKWLSLSSLNIDEYRFDIPKRLNPPEEPESIRLMMDRPPSGNAKITVKNNGEEIFEDIYRFYSPANMFPFIPYEYWKIKYENDFASFMVIPKDSSVTGNIELFKGDEGRSLRSLAKIVKLARAFCDQNSNLTIRLDSGDTWVELPLSMHHIGASDNSELFNNLTLIENAWLLIKEFDVLEDLQTFPRELLSQRGGINFSKLVFGGVNIDSVSVNVSDISELNLQSIALLFMFWVVIASKVFVVVGTISGEAKTIKANDVYKLIIEKGKLGCIQKRIYSKNDSCITIMEQLFDESKTQLESEGVESIIYIKDGFQIIG